MCVVLVTQRPTADAFGSNQLRENSALRIAFALANRDGASAALGDEIRQHPSYCPTSLQDPAYIGVATARLRTGLDPFVRLRVPEVPRPRQLLNAHEVQRVSVVTFRHRLRSRHPSPNVPNQNRGSGLTAHRGRMTSHEIIGERFGRLVVLRELPRAPSGNRCLECQCDCGTIKAVLAGHLTSGATRSCGCLSRELTAAQTLPAR